MTMTKHNHEVELVRDAEMIILDGAIALPSDCRSVGCQGSYGIYNFDPTYPFWEEWHADNDGMRAAGFRVFKKDGKWHGAFYARMYEYGRRTHR